MPVWRSSCEGLVIGLTYYSIYDPFFVFEGKRLPAPRSDREREYVSGGTGKSGGMQRFKLGLHGARLLSAALVAEGENTVPLGPMIMERIGRFRSTLKNFGPTDFERSAIYEHNLPGFGRVPCPARGIVEPIVYAMQVAIQHFGPVMDDFVEFAIEDRDPALMMRLYVAASSLTDSSGVEIRDRAARMKNSLSGALDQVFEVIHPSNKSGKEGPDDTSPE